MMPSSSTKSSSFVVTGGLGSAHAPFGRDIAEGPAVELGPGIREQQPIRAAPDGQHLPALAVDHGQGIGMLEAPDHGGVTTGRRPPGNGVGAQVGLGGGVHVLGGLDVHTPSPGLFDECGSLRRPAVVVRALGIEVAEDDLRAGLLADADALFDGCEVPERRIAGPEVPVVGVVDGSGVLRGHPVQLDDLVGLGEDLDPVARAHVPGR